MRTRGTTLQERGEKIAEQTMQRAHKLWERHRSSVSHPLTFRDYLIENSKDRISALVGVRSFFSLFPAAQQVEATCSALQRLIDTHPELAGPPLMVTAGVAGLPMTPLWRSYWQVRV